MAQPVGTMIQGMWELSKSALAKGNMSQHGISIALVVRHCETFEPNMCMN